MKRFKVKQGIAEVYDISSEEFEKRTKQKAPFVESTINGKRCLAICPACDNPIQLIGLYTKTQRRPYGKHYGKTVPNLAKHNQQAYHFCPYATNSRTVNREGRKEKLTDYEKRIYYTLRNYFDKAIYIIQQDTGIYITQNMAKRILQDYLNSEGYMYYWATLYNLPWMLLYFSISRPCFGVLVKKNSALSKYLSTRKDVELKKYENMDYYQVGKNCRFLDLEYSTILHRRTVENDEVKETITFDVHDTGKDGLPKTVFETIFHINEHRFPNLISSKNANNFRNESFLEIARNLMPDLQ